MLAHTRPIAPTRVATGRTLPTRAIVVGGDGLRRAAMAIALYRAGIESAAVSEDADLTTVVAEAPQLLVIVALVDPQKERVADTADALLNCRQETGRGG